LERYLQHPTVLQVVQMLQKEQRRVRVSGMRGAQESFVLASVAGQTPYFHVWIANGKEEAAYRYNDLQSIIGDAAVCFFPDSFKSPASFRNLHPAQMLQRSETISKITGPTRPSIVVTYPEALFEKVVRPEILQKSRIDVKKGEKLDTDWMIEVLIEYGFERTDFVFEPGQFSIRGGIFDLFSYGNELPYRIELFDDEVENIRIFDPLTQLSTREINELTIIPNLNTRFKQTEKVSFLQIVPENTILWLKNEEDITTRLLHCMEGAEQFAAQLTAFDDAQLREIFRDRAFLYPEEVQADMYALSVVYVD
jgi:transcription-repair coupling factor (superfamily II helicase)